MDNKMELFFDAKRWQNVLVNAEEKRIDKSFLIQLCKPEPKLKLLATINSGKYKVAMPHIAMIPKPNSTEMRKVYVNERLDRIVLTLINEVYFQMYGHMIHKNCVSYKKGIGAGKVVKDLSRKMNAYGFKEAEFMGYKIDVRKFFDSVNRETLNEALESLSTNSPLDQIVYDYYNDDHIIDENGEIVEKYKSIAQGSAVSAFLANYILRDIDEALSSLDIIYYRYSDDIIMLGKDAKKAKGILDELLNKKGLEANEKKTEELFFGSPFSFLGFELKKDAISFGRSKIKSFKKEVKKICKMKKGMKRKDLMNIKKGIKSINNWLYLAYEKNPKNFGWANFYFGVINNREQIRELDFYIKDHLRHLYTNRWGSKSNYEQVSNDTLRDLGYVSMVQLYDCFSMKRELFQLEIAQM